MTVTTGRRELLAALGCAAAAWPISARAQQPTMPVVGWLGSETRKAEDSRIVPFFREGLKEGGYSEGQNVTIEYRFADGHYDRLPALAADLVHRPVNAIALTGQPAALAAKAATTTIPIVFQIADDPVQLGLVASLSRPGGNMTGVTSLNVQLVPKQLELLHEWVPTATVMALVVNPASPARAESNTREAQVAARRLGLKLYVLHASSEQDFDAALANAIQLRAGALVIGTDAFFFSRSGQLGAMTARHAIPAICPYRDFAAAGGLMSYGTNTVSQYRQVGVYTIRILKGEKPADLPVQQAVKLDLFINLRTAKALGVTVPLIMQMTADEVIE
jgi:putative tryptophan/tyrosine transport system substrate-binding protein